jgi:hypothetical protein
MSNIILPSSDIYVDQSAVRVVADQVTRFVQPAVSAWKAFTALQQLEKIVDESCLRLLGVVEVATRKNGPFYQELPDRAHQRELLTVAGVHHPAH